eukprot:CAMPEP_0119521098 /NCGR_PEP_ID=MMETSP1344-20130328/36910_1 /TAXON_ID=236787 /ORGANISM="Florenciella parvula, Strain CCMP2471" /LENGTH=554 /DNA_ID=CAMNT_0007559041 /DNA_START=39 /DNA_END=1703 /DNA_ORIENTATION=-
MNSFSQIPEGEEVAGVVTPVAPRRSMKWGVIAAAAVGLATVGYVSTKSTSTTSALDEVAPPTDVPPSDAPSDADSTNMAWMERDDVKRISAQKVVYGDMTPDDIASLFVKFQSDFNRDYSSVSETEEADRFVMFKKNLVMIDALNRQNPLAKFGITEAGDYTEEERNMKKMSTKYANYENMKANLPAGVVDAASKGPAHVAGMQFDVNVPTDGHSGGGRGGGSSSSTEAGGTDMQTGQVSWASEDDCAACSKFPGLHNYTTANRPDDFDWRELGAVTEVKNQKYCGSCWTFSTAADVEGTHFLATDELISLSEQQIVACDSGMDGCEGGYMYAAMQYVTKTGGLVTDEAYPYKGIMMDYEDNTPSCDTALITKTLQADEDDKLAHIEGFQMVAMGDDYEDLMATVLLKNGPLSVAINANGMEYYEFGITGCETIAGETYCEAGSISTTTPCDPTSLDHGVLAVAYGVQDGTDYWVIKNSWGSEWGEEGYYRLTRGDNHCGVANMVVHSVYKNSGQDNKHEIHESHVKGVKKTEHVEEVEARQSSKKSSKKSSSH